MPKDPRGLSTSVACLEQVFRKKTIIIKNIWISVGELEQQ